MLPHSLKQILQLIAVLFLLNGCFTPTDTLVKHQNLEKAIGSYPAKIEEIKAPFPMPQLKKPVFPDRVFNIIEYGAKGDSIAKNTEAFRKAIAACSASGGGKVLVPAGKWLTGAIHLKSHVNLHFEAGAELHFSTNPKDYLPVVLSRWAGFEVYNYSPLISAKDCENIAITGPGKLYGHGKPWHEWIPRMYKTCEFIYTEQVLKNVPPEERIYGTPEAGLRPPFISPVNCKNVLLEGFIVDGPGPFWTIQPYKCENVIIRGLDIDTQGHSKYGGINSDGIDIDACKNVLIEYCKINAGDDCIALKSGINEDGWRVGKPTENVVIRHILGGQCHGGIVIGSEMSGGIRNVFAYNCEFNRADRGIRLKSNASRGGVVEKLWFEDIKMTEIKAEAIIINSNYGAWMASKNGTAYPQFRDITIRNVNCNGAGIALKMKGTQQEPLEHINLEHVTLKATKGMSFEWITGLNLKNVESISTKGEPVVFKNCQNVTEKK